MPTRPHDYYDHTEAVNMSNARVLQTSLDALTQDVNLELRNTWPLAYIEVFVDSLPGLSQWHDHLWIHMQIIFLQDLCKLFYPMYC